MIQNLSLLQDYRERWKPFQEKKKVYLHLILWIVIALGLGFATVYFLRMAELRQTVTINDPLFTYFNPIDFSWPIFFFMYFTVIFGIIDVGRDPNHFLLGLQAFSLTMILRMLTIYLTPLSPPEKMIFLIDPFSKWVFGGGDVATKDLLFSGHTCTAHLIYMMGTSKKTKLIFLGCTAFIVLGLFAQQVHYTIDLIVAPFISYSCYYFALRFNPRPNFSSAN